MGDCLNLSLLVNHHNHWKTIPFQINPVFSSIDSVFNDCLKLYQSQNKSTTWSSILTPAWNYTEVKGL